MAPTPQNIGVHVLPEQGINMPRNGEEVVISGISGIFPNSNNAVEFAENLFNKVDMISEDDLHFQHPEAPKHFGKIDGLQKFDAQFFRVTYNHALAMEPMSRKLLEQAYMAMYDSGINPLAYQGRKVGVFIGSSYTDTSNVAMYNSYNNNGYVLSGCGKSMFSNRISYWIDAKGPSYTLDCSCASSTVCLEHAFTAMTKGECEAAVVGGCNICFEPNLGLNMGRSGMLSLDGKTKCFDKNGDGSVRSEAISCIFLQKAKDAKRIYAEVCFAQVTYGLKEDAQFLPLRRSEDIEKFLNNFYLEAGVSPKKVEYIEANGSATSEADANELIAIEHVFAKDKQVKVGSVKSNMGNSEPASGVCAITKVCLAYHEGKLPANLHYNEPIDVPALKEGKIQVLTENETFSRGLTAVNNFSINGTNCHVLLKGHYKPKDITKYKCNIPRLVLISGRQEECVEKIVNILKSQPIDPEVIGMLHNIYQIDTPGHTCRGYTILDTNEKSETVSLGQSAEYYSGTKKPLWLVFSGMGSQWPGMAADLMRIPTFANAIHKCHKALEPLGVDLIKVLTEPDKTIFDKILNCFIGISAVQIGLTDVMKEIGLVPDYVIGHSQGEMGCAYFDGCFTTEDMILAAYSRGFVSAESKFIKGSMAAVGLGYKDILPLCPPEIDIACHNSNESATLSGPADALKQFVAELTAKGIFAREVPSTNIAFHSRYIAHAGPSFLERLNAIIKEPTLRSEKWISTSIPEDRWDEPLAKYSSAEYHTNNLLSPVYFEEASRLIPDDAVVVEVAPHGLLQAILKRSHPECTHIPLTRRGTTDQVKFLFDAFGKLYQEGFNFKIDALYPKIEFPVSTETQLISHYVDWEHSEEWPAVINNVKETINTAIREFIMSVHDDEYKYFAGYIRDGNNIFPEAAILVLVWETLAMYKGVKFDDLSVVFKDVQFHGDAIIVAEEPFKLNFKINKGNDYFEVDHNGVMLANGYIAEIIKPNFGVLQDDEENENEEVLLKTEDVYKLLHVKGLTYKGEFQSIKGINFKRSNAQVKWTNNWITFIDSLFQLNVFARDYEGVTSPKIVNKLTISMNDHIKAKFVEIDNETYYNAKYFSVYGVTRCAGVEIRHIIFEDQPIKEIEPDVLESLSFVPYSVAGDVNFEVAVQVILQTVSDNIEDDTLKVTEVIDDSRQSLVDVLQKAGKYIPNIDLDIQSVYVNKVKAERISKSNLIVLQDFRDNGQKINDIFEDFSKNTYVLALKENVVDFNHSYFTIISSIAVNQEHLVLLKKRDSVQYTDVTCISIDNNEKFGWIPILQSELQKTKRIVLVSERQPYCGLLGLVKKLRKENGDRIVLVIVDDYHAPNFDKDKPIFKEQLQKNLAFNIYLKGQWGSYYYVPNSGINNIQNFKLAYVPGVIDNVKWSEIPTLPTSKNLVQVCYAGASVRDSQKAVGMIENDQHDFGLDFSGFDINGDRVMGLTSGGALASTVQADPDLLWPVPQHWSLEEAATVPLPYVHACYCLVIRGQLLKRQSVFVSGGAGALGQAIISICLSLNCTVYTSVSDLQKKQLLLQLFPQLKGENISCSQNGSFKNMVIVNSKGNLCDFVINYANGESREAAMKCVAEYGIFLDVSSYDLKQNKPFGMSYVEKDRSYLGINLASIFRPENAKQKKMLQLIVTQGIINGTIKPLSRIVYPTTDVSRAFRLLSSNKHRGRVLIRIRNGDIPTKCLSIIPRVTFSSKGTYVVLCDKSELGVELANRLVRRGVRNLILHLKSKIVSGYLHIKMANWLKIGTTVKISTDNLSSDQSCAQLLKDAEKLGRVHGLFIIQDTSVQRIDFQQRDFLDKYEKFTSVLANLDVLTRNNCPELSNFVVISRSSQNIVDEYATSVCDKICQGRIGVGLPGLSFRVELLDELQLSKYDGKLRPQTIRTVLNALETSLKEKQSSVITYNLRRRKDFEFLENVAKCLGINNLDDVDKSLTVSNFITNEVNLEQLRKLIKDALKIDNTVENLKQFSIRSLETLSKGHSKPNTKFDNGLGAFYTLVDQDEFLATDVSIPMRTIINKKNETNELDGNAAHLMFIPGFEGHYHIFTSICERLKIDAMTFQLGPDLPNNSITELALNIMKFIKKTFVFKSKFYLLGYSFGVNVALEVASLLEKEGHRGIVYCLDSSPDVIQLQLEAYIGKLTDSQLENTIIEHMYNLMTGEESNEINQDLERLENWHDKVDVCVRRLNKSVTYTSQYIRNVLESAYRRILLTRDYKPEFQLESELILIKGIPHPKAESFESDYGLSKYSKKPVKVFDIESDHATAPQDCRISNIVNKLLDPELLEEFKTKNLCETYLTDC